MASAAVVSLPGSDRRRGFFAQPLAGVFEVAEAFHGATQDWTPYFDAARFAEHYGRAPVAAEIGCAISHARVIRDFAAEAGAGSDVLLVAEDDARFTEDFARVGRTLLQPPLRHDVVVLGDGWTRHRRTAVRRQLMGISQVSRLSRVLRGGSGSTASGGLRVTGTARGCTRSRAGPPGLSTTTSGPFRGRSWSMSQMPGPPSGSCAGGTWLSPAPAW